MFVRGVDDSLSHIRVPCGTQTYKQIRIRTHVPHIRTLHHKLDPAVDNTLTLACMTTLPVTFCEKVKASIVVVCQHTHYVAPASSIAITFTSVIH